MKCVDIFAGCGGLSLGFANAGFNVVCAFDNWQQALEIYRANFDHPAFELDLSNAEQAIDAIKPYAPAIIIGGPPCQDFSSAGKRDTSLGRADLTRSFQEIICAVSPDWFVMENVDLITKTQLLQEVIAEFKKENYGLTACILDASFCGVPQKRNRFFMIGKKGAPDNFLLGNLISALAEKPLSVYEYMGGELDVAHYYRHPRNYNRRAIYSLHEPSATIRGVNRPIPKGYKINSCDPLGVDLKDIRPLSFEERARIQTFPKDFIFFGTKTNKEQMIGNAVPVNLGKFIGAAILDFEKNGAAPFTKQEALFPDEFILPTTTLNRFSQISS